EAVQTVVGESSIIPLSFLAVDVWPQDPPRDDGAEKQRNVYQGQDGKQANEADEEKESDHPTERGLLDVEIRLGVLQAARTYMYLPLNATPEHETTQVWITVFSWRVKGRLSTPTCSSAFVHIFTRKNPSNPAETLSDGMIPVVRFSFMTMKLRKNPSMRLTTSARAVICSVHFGTSLQLSNSRSTDSSSPAAAAIPASSRLPRRGKEAGAAQDGEK
ncbi:hypothetical protein ACMD2_05090, partial [Ananas comosus]